MNNKCLICNCKNIKKTKAMFADFISDRVFNGTNKQFNLIYCPDCGFAYYDYRFSTEDCTKLYSGYRDEQYQKQRQKHECWYTKEINDLIGKNDAELISRNENLKKIIQKHIKTELKSILDFGGDKGQFIPDLHENIEKYVYEISGVEPVDGVQTINTLEDCVQHNYDLIICANVLEHAANPLEIIKQIKSLLKKGQHLYVELPFDSPFYKSKFFDFQFLFNKYYTWTNIFKHFMQIKKNGNVRLMHEHINYFTPQSIKFLLEQEGFMVLHNERKTIDVKWGKFNLISTLCVLN